MVFDLVGDEPVLGFTVVEEQCGGIGIALMQAIVLIRFDVFLYVFIESVGHRIMAHGPEICLRQICQTFEAKMLLFQEKPLPACYALSGKQYFSSRTQSPQNTPFHDFICNVTSK